MDRTAAVPRRRSAALDAMARRQPAHADKLIAFA